MSPPPAVLLRCTHMTPPHYSLVVHADVCRTDTIQIKKGLEGISFFSEAEPLFATSSLPLRPYPAPGSPGEIGPGPKKELIFTLQGYKSPVVRGN